MDIDGRKIRVDYSITARAHTPTPGVYMGRPTGLKTSVFLSAVQGKLPCGDGCGENDEDKEEEEALMGPNQSGLEVDNDSEHSSGKDSGTGTDNDPRLHIYSHHHLSLHDPDGSTVNVSDEETRDVEDEDEVSVKRPLRTFAVSGVGHRTQRLQMGVGMGVSSPNLSRVDSTVVYANVIPTTVAGSSDFLCPVVMRHKGGTLGRLKGKHVKCPSIPDPSR
ncbi:unnamed protein product [Darwinula stevensoni]|uniref:Uncharacterized protein n=1 Tax=Darwinula stevensoni TaxID=69355 RepID=A0A7R8X3J5_9CRUS|nr:unnamed protein product [Darwinula stevensoni]CAG0885074.1 unnamed protein product [Darwinula stevensoni]